MITRIRVVLLLVALELLAASSASAREKTDVIVLVNGDHITGEIKKMERGLVTLKTDAMSTVSIEWADVLQLQSRHYFEFEDSDGFKYYGVPELSDSVFRVINPTAVATFEKRQIVRITPIEESFWDRVKGSVSLGGSYTKGSHVAKLDIAAEANYRVEKNYVQIKASTNLTAQEDVQATRRSEGLITYQRLFKRKWYSDNNFSTYLNDELGIALRATLATGLGVHLVRTNWHMVEGSIGVAFNREWATADSIPASNNVEGVVSMGYSVFKYNTPKTTLDSDIAAYPRLPRFDRFRLDISVKLRQEIITDFFWDVDFYDNYNSSPPSETAAKNDWGIVTSFGYTF